MTAVIGINPDTHDTQRGVYFKYPPPLPTHRHQVPMLQTQYTNTQSYKQPGHSFGVHAKTGPSRLRLYNADASVRHTHQQDNA